MRRLDTPRRAPPNSFAPRFERLVNRKSEHSAPFVPELPRFTGGAVGFLSYDLSASFEPLALALLSGPQARRARSAVLTQIGNAYLKAGSPRQALNRFHKALVLSRAAGSSSGEASALNGVGLAWKEIGRPDRALAPLRRALALFEQRGDSLSARATVWINIGWLHLSQDRPRSASQAFGHALELASRAGDRESW